MLFSKNNIDRPKAFYAFFLSVSYKSNMSHYKTDINSILLGEGKRGSGDYRSNTLEGLSLMTDGVGFC